MSTPWSDWLEKDRAALEIEHVSGGRALVATLAHDGRLAVRPRGGPDYHMGRLMNQRSERLPRWLGSAPPDLHARVCAALRTAGFPDVELMPLVPDETPSAWVVRHTSGATAAISASHRVSQAFLELGQVANELSYLAYTLREAGPATDSIPNPELDHWS
jgi:hypothetical protein